MTDGKWGTHDLRAALHRVELDAYADDIAGLALPAAYLGVHAGEQGEARGSRLGGEPWLDDDVEWPLDPHGRPLDFVLQVAARDLPENWQGHRLRPDEWPADGVIALFVGLSASSFGIPHRVVMSSRAGGIRRAPAAPEPEAIDLRFAEEVPAARLDVRIGWDVPRWASTEWARLDEEVFDGEEDAAGYESLGSLLEPFPGSELIGRVFGHVAGIGADPRDDIPSSVPATEWEHLITLESSMAVDLTIADAGYLQVLSAGAGNLETTFCTVETS